MKFTAFGTIFTIGNANLAVLLREEHSAHLTREPQSPVLLGPLMPKVPPFPLLLGHRDRCDQHLSKNCCALVARELQSRVLLGPLMPKVPPFPLLLGHHDRYDQHLSKNCCVLVAHGNPGLPRPFSRLGTRN